MNSCSVIRPLWYSTVLVTIMMAATAIAPAAVPRPIRPAAWRTRSRNAANLAVLAAVWISPGVMTRAPLARLSLRTSHRPFAAVSPPPCDRGTMWLQSLFRRNRLTLAGPYERNTSGTLL